MKRMVDNKLLEQLENNTNLYIDSVVKDGDDVTGLVVKDSKNGTEYNINLSGGGKQLYQHNITLFGVPSNTIKIQLLSDDKKSFNFTKLKDWLIEKGFETSGMDTKYYYKTSGHSSNNTVYEAIAYDNTNNTFRLWFGGSCITYNFNDSDFIDDTII